MDKDLPKRKQIRIQQFNYKARGAYFITICAKNREQIFSEITAIENAKFPQIPVGDGASTSRDNENAKFPQIPVGDGASTSRIITNELTPIGKIVEKHLRACENIKNVKINNYIIMPDHLHAIIVILSNETTCNEKCNEKLPKIISAFKRLCNKEIGYNIFQRSYYEHIIRNKDDYYEIQKYIHDNPIKWFYNYM